MTGVERETSLATARRIKTETQRYLVMCPDGAFRPHNVMSRAAAVQWCEFGHACLPTDQHVLIPVADTRQPSGLGPGETTSGTRGDDTYPPRHRTGEPS